MLTFIRLLKVNLTGVEEFMDYNNLTIPLFPPSVDPSRFQDSWRLSDGFVASEAKIILPHRARSR